MVLPVPFAWNPVTPAEAEAVQVKVAFGGVVVSVMAVVEVPEHIAWFGTVVTIGCGLSAKVSVAVAEFPHSLVTTSETVWFPEAV